MAQITITDRTIRVVSVGELPDHEWRRMVKEHGLQDHVFDVADYSFDGLRHEWVFTYSPVSQRVR